MITFNEQILLLIFNMGDILPKAQFNLKHKEVLDTFLLDIPFVNPGKMYGHPAYYVGGKLNASLFREGVCVTYFYTRC